VTQTATKQHPETSLQNVEGVFLLTGMLVEDSREWQAQRLRLFWKRRCLFLQTGTLGLVASTLVAFLIPKSFTSTAQVMLLGGQSPSLAMLAAMALTKGARP
jgi:hypothetical protein